MAGTPENWIIGRSLESIVQMKLNSNCVLNLINLVYFYVNDEEAVLGRKWV